MIKVEVKKSSTNWWPWEVVTARGRVIARTMTRENAIRLAEQFERDQCLEGDE
jgi:hypothetical protein